MEIISDRFLPAWKDEWSDGCSGVVDLCKECCVRHDEAYYYGGSEQDRLKADREFLACMLKHRMPFWRANTRYLGVRAFGIPQLKWKNVSWSFGGNYFKYSDRPAKPALEGSLTMSRNRFEPNYRYIERIERELEAGEFSKVDLNPIDVSSAISILLYSFRELERRIHAAQLALSGTELAPPGDPLK